jgi:hypothetical protein
MDQRNTTRRIPRRVGGGIRKQTQPHCEADQQQNSPNGFVKPCMGRRREKTHSPNAKIIQSFFIMPEGGRNAANDL